MMTEDSTAARVLRLRRSLSSRLLWLTIFFVMGVEVMVYIPSIANFRKTFLDQHLATAQVAALAGAGDGGPDETVRMEILRTAGVLSVRLDLGEGRVYALSEAPLPPVAAHYDLRRSGPLALIAQAFETLGRGGRAVVEIRAAPINLEGRELDIVMREDRLFEAMAIYSRNIFILSIIISFVTAGLVFLSIYVLLVRPLKRLTRAMVRFRDAPEDPANLLIPSERGDELGLAEAEFARMQTEIRQALHQRKRLADLGEAVSKVNHDLRNILATAQLSSDRLLMVEDPAVRELSERLIRAVDRAIDLCERTLKYGRADEPPPHPQEVVLCPLVEEVALSLGLREGRVATARAEEGAPENELPAPPPPLIRLVNEVPKECRVQADIDQLFRILLNLGRNAVEALAGQGGEIRISARPAPGGMVIIEVADNGPGLPEQARRNLFIPFKGAGGAKGIGLGLAIVSELVRANGGTVWLERSDASGTVFAFRLPAAESRTAASGLAEDPAPPVEPPTGQ